MRFFTFLIPALFALPMPAAALTLSFSEANFANEDFSFVRLSGPANGQSATQVPTTPSGTAIQMRTNTDAITENGLLVDGFTVNLGQRALNSLSWSVDLTGVNVYGQGQGYGLLLEQGGNFFLGDWSITGTSTTLQTRGATGLVREDFGRIGGGVGPSFAQGSAPISFGLYTGNDRGNAISVIYDNLSVSADVTGGPTPIPLPAAVWLLGSAVAGLGFVARLRRRA